MGWHVNRGPDELASFFPAGQFRKSLYRPDVVKWVLKTGSVAKALEATDAERGKKTQPVDVAEVLPPKVRLTAPERALAVKEAVLEVTARAASTGKHPVTALQLMMNGRPLAQSLFRIDAPRLGEVTHTWTVTLSAGKQTLAVQANSAVSNSTSDEVEVTYIPPDPIETIKLPSLYVLAVGVSEYPGELKLNFAHKDAQTLARAFREHSKALFEKTFPGSPSR
jgi:hypothetical protein